MKLQLHSTLAALLLSSVVAGCGEGVGTEVVLDPSYYTNKYDYADTDSFLGRGINMGNYLEAEGDEGAWTGGRKIQEEDLALIEATGFKSVRIPVRWSDHTGATDPYAIDAAFLARVKEVVGWAIAADLKVVLNTHHYTEMMDQGASSLPGHRARLKAIWQQICEAFPATGYPVDRLVFELLNEPNGAVGSTEWNDMVAELTTIIWTDNAATQAGRKVMVGTASWGGPGGLETPSGEDILVLPEACTPENTIVTIHWYEPFHFTHQGADWVSGSGAWRGTIWRGTDADQAPLLSLFGAVEHWNEGKGFEIFVGEFGVFSKYARADYRKAWTAFIAREAEARGMSWAYWEFDQGFGAYDREAESWRPEILDALIPVGDRPAAN